MPLYSDNRATLRLNADSYFIYIGTDCVFFSAFCFLYDKPVFFSQSTVLIYFCSRILKLLITTRNHKIFDNMVAFMGCYRE